MFLLKEDLGRLVFVFSVNYHNTSVNGFSLLQVACFTEEDWQELCQSLADASSKNEKILYRTLKEDFLPEIPNLFAEKERQQRYSS